jgi:hypothetical protein
MRVCAARATDSAWHNAGMRSPSPVLSLSLACVFALSLGCRHTAEGVKADTKRAVEKTGKGIEKAGEKIQKAGEKVENSGK